MPLQSPASPRALRLPSSRPHPITRVARVALVALVAGSLLVPLDTPPPAAAAPTGTDPAGGARSTPLGDPLLTATRVVHADDGSSTEVVTRSQGDAYGSLVENRAVRHSTLQPTGRFVTAGDDLVVQLPEDGAGIRLAIGAYGAYGTRNGGRDVGMAFRDLTPGTTTTVAAPHAGMVYLEDGRAGDHVTDVEVSGGSPTPTFVRGQTSTADFRAQVERWPDAPMTTLVGHRVLAEFQMNVMRPESASLDAEARTAYFDRVVELSNESHGLVDGAAGLAGKLRHRIHFSNPDAGPGWGSASPLHLTFQNSSGAGRHILTRPESDQWGLWHEIGHTYQTPTYTWTGMIETSVNVGPLHIQDALGFPVKLDEKGYQDLYDQFFGRPVDQRDIDAGGDMRLLMIDQLRRAFGGSALPRVNQHLRVRLASGEQINATSDSRKQAFATSAAQALGRDLRPFFEQFGFPLDAASRAVMAELPALERPIWQNRLSGEPVVETLLPAYSVPTATIVPADERPALRLGQTTLDDLAGYLTDVRDGSDGAEVVDVAVDATRAGTATGSIDVTLESSSGVRDVVRVTADVRPGTSFRFAGASGAVFGGLALDPDDSRLRAVSTGTVAHPATGGARYLGVAVHSPEGGLVATATVRGRDTGAALVEALDGLPYVEGTRLVITQLEAHTTTRFDDDVDRGRPASLTHAWQIVDDRLVPDTTMAVEVPAHAVTELAPGGATAIETGIVTVRSVNRLQGTVVFTAPEGSDFTPGQTTLDGQIRHPGGSWFGNRTVQLTAGELSDDGRTLSFRLDTTVAGFGTQDGSLVRWSPRVATAPDAPAGASTLGIHVTGSSNHGPMDALGASPTTTAAILRVSVREQSNIARTATVAGTAVPGATLRSGTQEALVQPDGSVELVVRELALGVTEIPVELWRDGTRLATDSFSVTLSDGLVLAEPGESTSLVSGLDAPVPVALSIGRTHEQLSGTVELTAPEGTTFAPVSGTVANEIRQTPAHRWQSSTSTPLRSVVLSADRRTLRATFASNGGSFLLPVGSAIRWSPTLRVPDGHQGVGALDYRVEGTGPHGDWIVEGASPTVNATRDDHVAPEPADAVDVDPGAAATVPTTFRFEEGVTSLRGSVAFRAPAGTRFAAGQTALAGMYRHTDMAEFRETGSLRLGSVTISDDGRELVGQLSPTGAGFSLRAGSLTRWQPRLEVHSPTVPHRTSVEATFRGVSSSASFSSTVTQPVRIGDAPEADLVPDEADTVSLARGGSTPVPFAVVATVGVTDLRAAVTVTAPTGTTFAADQTALATEQRSPGGGRAPATSIELRDVVVSADGTTLTFTVQATDGFDLPRASSLRWSPEVLVPEDAAAGSFGLGWVLEGTTERGSVTAGA